MYVSDLDGTLLTRGEYVSAYSREKLNGLIESGMTFTFATARSAQSAFQAVEGLLLRTPVILYNGGLIYDFNHHNPLHFELFSPELKDYVLFVLRSFGIEPFVYDADEEGRHERVVWNSFAESDSMKRYLSRRTSDSRMHPVNGEEIAGGYVFNFKCVGPKELIERAWNVLKYDSRLICIFHQETYHSDYWMEISPREATKANAVIWLKKHLGCERAVCFGDTSNDSDMFDVCDKKFAVQNADEWLKEKATAVIGYCEEDGVAKWLEANSGFPVGKL